MMEIRFDKSDNTVCEKKNSVERIESKTTLLL